jgi:hypothetical protein
MRLARRWRLGLLYGGNTAKSKAAQKHLYHQKTDKAGTPDLKT